MLAKRRLLLKRYSGVAKIDPLLTQVRFDWVFAADGNKECRARLDASQEIFSSTKKSRQAETLKWTLVEIQINKDECSFVLFLRVVILSMQFKEYQTNLRLYKGTLKRKEKILWDTLTARFLVS